MKHFEFAVLAASAHIIGTSIRVNSVEIFFYVIDPRVPRIRFQKNLFDFLREFTLTIMEFSFQTELSYRMVFIGLNILAAVMKILCFSNFEK